MKLFKLVKEIRARNGDLHFKRWAIVETKYFNLYLHHIYIEDREAFQHSHPWNFIGLILKGGYIEQRGSKLRTVRPGFLTWANRKAFHTVTKLLGPKSVSLFFTFGKHQDWYFRTNNGDVESREYFRRKNEQNPKDS